MHFDDLKPAIDRVMSQVEHEIRKTSGDPSNDEALQRPLRELRGAVYGALIKAARVKGIGIAGLDDLDSPGAENSET